MSSTVTLPGGLWRDGVLEREAIVAPLTGADEEAVLEPSRPRRNRAELVSSLLARCVQRLGSASEMTPEVTDTLCIGDREALLLHIRRETVGGQMDCVVECTQCGAAMDLELSIDELLLPAYQTWRPEYRETFDVGGVRRRVRFKLPTGADQGAAALAASHDLGAAEAVFVQRCVLDVDGLPPDALPGQEVVALLADALAPRFVELDPQAELSLEFNCTECGATQTSYIDSADFVLRELTSGSLYHDVHTLALHYHWREQDILAMTRPKRRLYLDLLAQASERGRMA